MKKNTCFWIKKNYDVTKPNRAKSGVISPKFNLSDVIQDFSILTSIEMKKIIEIEYLGVVKCYLWNPNLHQTLPRWNIFTFDMILRFRLANFFELIFFG